MKLTVLRLTFIAHKDILKYLFSFLLLLVILETFVLNRAVINRLSSQ